MKYKYVVKDNHPTLTLFFAGWGMDEHPFSELRPIESDFMVCYDYRSLEFDWSLIENYTAVKVVAWSMGVWAATQAGLPVDLPIVSRIAINGTPWPVDNQYGILQNIFEGTLAGLNENTLRKFQLRMCGGGEAFREFQQIAPQRTVDELRTELATIGELYQTLPEKDFAWDIAHAGQKDMIFPYANQLAAWEKAGVKVSAGEDAHYDASVFKHYLNAI